MTKTALDRSIGEFTLRELRDFIRQVVREESPSRWRTDKDGNLLFLFEEDYAAYLAEQKGKLPSEVKAYFIDQQGFTARYADEVPTAATRRRIEKAKREIAEGRGLTLEAVRQRLQLR
jgi:hypothetical protein